MSNPSSDISLLGKIASYTEILAKDAHSTAFVPLSDAYRQMGLLDDALEVAEKGVQALPRFSPGYMILGRILFERADLAAAAAAFEKARAIDSESVSAIKGLARVLVRQGGRERARELLEKAAMLDPKDASIGKMLAALPARPVAQPSPTRPPVEAVKAKEPIATSTIAEIYLQQGFPQRALKVYLDLQANHPGNEELNRKVAELKNLVQKAGEAESPARSGVFSLPEAPQALAAVPLAVQIGKPVANPADMVKAFALETAGSADRQVEALSRWLTAIRVRRQHVLQ